MINTLNTSITELTLVQPEHVVAEALRRRGPPGRAAGLQRAVTAAVTRVRRHRRRLGRCRPRLAAQRAPVVHGRAARGRSRRALGRRSAGGARPVVRRRHRRARPDVAGSGRHPVVGSGCRASTCAGAASAARRRSTRSSRCRANRTTTTTGSGNMAASGWSWRDVGAWFHRTRLVLQPCIRRRVGRGQPWRWAQRCAEAAGGVPLTRDPTGARVSVNDAYLEPARGREVCRSWATRWSTACCSRAAGPSGVRTVAGDEIEADLVVVSAGAIHSPAILLRSGVDTPGVGDNLHDHPSFPIADPTAPSRRSPAGCAIATLAAAVVAAGAPRSAAAADRRRRSHDAPPRAADGGADARPLARFGAVGERPTRTVDPVVDFAMLDDERDWPGCRRRSMLPNARSSIRRCERWATSFRTTVRRRASRAALGDYVHAAGTCAMGTVVDSSCRLVGYDGVVVCDASVMPQLPARQHAPADGDDRRAHRRHDHRRPRPDR